MGVGSPHSPGFSVGGRPAGGRGDGRAWQRPPSGGLSLQVPAAEPGSKTMRCEKFKAAGFELLTGGAPALGAEKESYVGLACDFGLF